MSKALLYASQFVPTQDLHAQLLEGVERVALAVGSTLGPRGCNVIIDRAGDVPQVTKDGVTVARNIQLTDRVLNSAAKLVIAVARATVDEAGDGTTTATVLSHAILKTGLEHIRAGAGPVQLQRAIQAAVAAVVGGIACMARIPSDQQIAQVATIATNGNALFGQLILEAIQCVGRDGLITIDDSNQPSSSVELREGFQIDSGFLRTEFITDKAHGVAILDNPYILITERQLSQGISQAASLHDPGPLLSFVAGLDYDGKIRERERRPLLIIADDVLEGSDAMQAFLVNHMQQLIQICIVRAPGYGDLKKAYLQDLAMATGGRVLTNDGGEELSRWVLDRRNAWKAGNLGQCRRAVISNRSTVLEGCPGDPADPELLQRFTAGLRQQAQEHHDPEQREFLLQRAARLNGQVAVLKIGAQTEAEAKALRDAAEDAVLAVRCAVTEGVVPGGGMALFVLARQLENSAADMPLPLAEGARVVANAMRAPLRMIAANAGEDPDSVCTMLENAHASRAVAAARGEDTGDAVIGFDAATAEYKDLFAAGIVDPAKVVRVALEKAASIAALMLTSSCLVYFDPEAEGKQPILQLPQLPGGTPRG